MSSDIEQEPPTQKKSKEVSDDEFWLVSYGESDDRELTTKEVVHALKRGEITLYSLVWREGMGEWQPISAIDELRARAGLIVQTFFSNPPPRSTVAQSVGIHGLGDDPAELLSSDVISAPPTSLAEADFLGFEDPDASLAPPLIDHAAFFKSDPPPAARKSLPGLPGLPGRPNPPSANQKAKAETKSEAKQGAPLKWLLLAFTAIAAAFAGFWFGTPEEPPPPQPVAALQVAPATSTTEAAPKVIPTEPDVAANEPAVQPARNDPAPSAASSVASGSTLAEPKSAAHSAAAQAPTPAVPPVATQPASSPAPAPAPRAPSNPVVASSEPFDKAAAGAALNQAAARAAGCRQQGDPSGTAQVEVTFGSSGRATRATVTGPPFQGTATGGCIAQEMRKAQVPAFAGDRVTVQKRVLIQ